MAKEYLECGVCGALIDPETGETRIMKGSNAASLEEQAALIERLQNDLSRIKEENDRLKAEMEELKNGTGNGNEPDSGGFFSRLIGR